MKIQSLCLTFGFAAALAVSACEDGDRAAVAEMGGANSSVVKGGDDATGGLARPHDSGGHTLNGSDPPFPVEKLPRR